ncbi:MAG: nucleotide-binding domain-containing protein [Thermomicrobiales bacterium]
MPVRRDNGAATRHDSVAGTEQRQGSPGSDGSEPRDLPGRSTRWEHTAYRGHHVVFCEIEKNRRVVASTRHDVRIRGQ